MSAPDRIWIDAWGGNWSPRSGGTQGIEYVRADRIDAISAALTQSRAETATLRSFIADFAAFEFAACYRHPTSSPEDEGDDVTDAEPVWAWQEDARALAAPDQTAALERMIAEAKADGWREAAAHLRGIISHAQHAGIDDNEAESAIKGYVDYILAAIPKGGA